MLCNADNVMIFEAKKKYETPTKCINFTYLYFLLNEVLHVRKDPSKNQAARGIRKQKCVKCYSIIQLL